ncbi:putative selenate reductase subunit YgfK [Clostridium subterminale]|uniref:Selenate reductase subunit YgfK n=1 Tax=Clostridium subterminale TaxID=1550 RepID=A0ABN1KYY9_CLOSU
MSDKMRPISFEKLINWIFTELKTKESIFGIHKDKFYYGIPNNTIHFLGESLGLPIGPAAGPSSQLAQNIIAAYLTGSRFIELKTVQIIDGEDLPVLKPCINAEDECYNVEWSTELTVEEAYEEYVKAWIILHVLMKELNLSQERDFVFNMSVGYDLDGIKSDKIDFYMENMKNSRNSKIWKESLQVLENNIKKFYRFSTEDLNKISSRLCNSITLSTLHGCPPQEIERIATYLLKEKHLHTFVKMNPTLLGEEFVRETFNKMGYEYIKLNSHHFKNDLKYDDGIKMIKKLKEVATMENLEIGVKLTNTLPVKILNEELPGEEMYMSGRSLYPLTINLASKLSKEFEGKLYISYSGGAESFNVEKIFATGICPITFATTILKPGGYERIEQIAKKIELLIPNRKLTIDMQLLEILAKESINDKHHLKEARIVKSRKIDRELPIYDCTIAPCSEGCPIAQQIPKYIELVGDGKYDEAFEVIVRDNAAPAITGTICNHNCQYKCTRLDYDSSLEIRRIKKIAVDNAEAIYTNNIKASPIKSHKNVAIIGAGVAGLSTALYLRRNGINVEVFEKRDKPYGVINYVIPSFRIDNSILEQDFQMVKSHGVKVTYGIAEQVDLNILKENFDYIVLATGAWKPGYITLKKGNDRVLTAIQFLEEFKKNSVDIKLGTHVCVIGGGDVAMDVARAAKRVNGVEKVTIIYRRTKDLMPASREEIRLAVDDGIEFRELLYPVALEDNNLVCERMILGEQDKSGRKSPISLGKYEEINATAVIAAIGEKVDSKFFENLGIELNSKGLPEVNSKCETNISNVYVAGDAKNGPGTIVEAMSHGKIITRDILRKENMPCDFPRTEKNTCGYELKKSYERKGVLLDTIHSKEETIRCLKCNKICEICVDVCPNRANMFIEIKEGPISGHQIIHLDGMCNECGNCGVFCPYKGNPYKDKITIFWGEEDFENSSNSGFYVIDSSIGICKVRDEKGKIFDWCIKGKNSESISAEMKCIIETCIKRHEYII